MTGHSQHMDTSRHLERDMSREYDSVSTESSPMWVRGPAVTLDSPYTGVGTDTGEAGGQVAPWPSPEEDLMVVPWDEVMCEEYEAYNYADRYRPRGALGPIRFQCAHDSRAPPCAMARPPGSSCPVRAGRMERPSRANPRRGKGVKGLTD